MNLKKGKVKGVSKDQETLYKMKEQADKEFKQKAKAEQERLEEANVNIYYTT